MLLSRKLLCTSLALGFSTSALAYDISLESYDPDELQVLQAAEKSDNPVQLMEAASVLLYESMLQENVVQGLVYLKKAAQKGSHEAESELADYYYYQQEDYAEALKWYHQAEKGQDAYVLYSLGVMYFDGEGTQVDLKKANEYYLAAAKLGYSDAMYELAFSYNDGKGVEKDFVQAAHWFKQAADLGDASAMYNLGIAYLNGEGVEKSCPTAMKLFNQAIDADEHVLSYATLGNLYYYPEYKRPCGFKTTDYKKSFSYFSEAAMWGDEYSQYMVGYSYRNGHGVYSDFVKALAWLSIAADNGYAKSAEAVKEVKRHMSRTDIEKAGELQASLEEEI